MKAVVAAFNQEKALVGAFSVITNLRMKLFEALVGKLDMAAIKTEAEAGLLAGHTAIKRHTIDAILGLPRLGGFPPGLQEAARASLAEAGDLGDRQDQLDVEGKIAPPPSLLLITHFRHQASSDNSVSFMPALVVKYWISCHLCVDNRPYVRCQ